MSNTHAIERFTKQQQQRGFSKRTVERRRQTAHALLRSVDCKPLTEISTDEVEDFLGQFACPQTRQSYRSDINQLYRFMKQRGLAEINPCDLIDPARVPVRAATPLTNREVRAVMAAASPTTRLMVMLAAFAGLRGSEIAALRGEDIDLDNRLLVVRNGKGGRDGSVPIADELARELEHWPRKGRIFLHVAGRSAVYNRIKTVFNRLDINHRPHDLRHSYATSAAKKSNGNLRAVQLLMRHASITSTERYVRYFPPGLDIVNGLYGGDAA